MSRQFYLKKFGRFSEKPYLCTAFRKRRGVAQLVAHLVWDQVVARSSRVTPTKKQRKSLQVQKKVVPLQRKNKNGALDEWLSLWSAKPATAVRIRQAPPKRTLYHLRYSVFLLLSDATFCSNAESYYSYCSNIIINFLKLQNAKTQNTPLYY